MLISRKYQSLEGFSLSQLREVSGLTDLVVIPGGSTIPWICGYSNSRRVIILPTLQDAESFSNDWETLYHKKPFFLRPVPLDKDSINDTAWAVKRGETLSRWMKVPDGLLVTTPGSLLSPLSKSGSFFEIRKGETLSRNQFIEWLLQNGFNHCDLVWSPAQFATRGYIIDVFDPGSSLPLRIEFFDEEVESIRLFKPNSQKGVMELQEAEIRGFAAVKKMTVQDLIELNPSIVLVNPLKIQTQAEAYIWLWNNLAGNSQDRIDFSWERLYRSFSHMEKFRIHENSEVPGSTRAPFVHCPSFKGKMEFLVSAIRKWDEEGHTIDIYSCNKVLKDHFAHSPVSFHQGTLTNGFIDNSRKRVVISDQEISGLTTSWYSSRSFNPAPMDWQDSLAPGEHVLHKDHGIAIFRGLESVVIEEQPQEMLVLEFSEGKRLLLPVFQLTLLTPLTVLPGEEPGLSVLGGKQWKRRAYRDRIKAREEAKAIVKIYASREMLKGYSFTDESSLFRDFEEAFPFNETEDQLAAITAVRNDMQTPVPMDRLLVGDVGYGKTEVALRAAFRAVDSGKQVAFLVPTTVLAQQHFQTVTIRFAGFPVNLACISRFQKKKEQQKILKGLEEGTIDIIIGTPRLIQKDVRFRDLGLVIVDEEHRFGVMQKEKLKQQYPLVDVLTLSATPIPRTFSLSMKGLRPLSVLSTPPENRIPVTTYVGPWDEILVQEAILRELQRGGQVFFVHNRIRTIYERAEEIRRMFPQSRVDIAHGQMDNNKLESTMLDFYDGNLDILVCTTIIESGLDVGNANTLIVDDSNEMGLAQLYQLRGRIGRRSEAAFAFFLYPRASIIDGDTRERLEAMASLPGMGGGYSLALHDLRIRGSGELIGTRQHGQRTAAGLTHYYDLLQEEIRKIRGEIYNEPEIVTLLDNSIPPFFIPQENVRIILYRRLLRIGSTGELHSLEEEIRDRFGPIPEGLLALLDITRLRILSRRTGLRRISVSERDITIEGPEDVRYLLFHGKPSLANGSKATLGPGGHKGLKYLISILNELSDEDHLSLN